MEKHSLLYEKLELFIRKYYVNRLLKGLMYGIGFSLAYFLLVSILEYYGHFGSEVRLGMFITLLTGLAGILGHYVAVPVIKLLKIGKRLTYKQAAQIVGKHFPTIDDKIVNTLQLQEASFNDSQLIQASIDQKVKTLSPIPFGNAINLGENKKYWPILVVPMGILVLLLISGKGEIVREGSKRIVEYQKEFLPEAPFQFVLENKVLKVEQGESLELNLSFTGSSVPDIAVIILPEGKNRMVRASEGKLQYKLENLQDGLTFRFEALGFLSPVYKVEVIPVPKVTSFFMNVEPPTYTGLKPYRAEVKAVEEVPEGSNVEWVLGLSGATGAYFISEGEPKEFETRGGLEYRYSQQVFKALGYRLGTKNEFVEKQGQTENRVEVLKDVYPKISVDFRKDSTAQALVYCYGTLSDDYGFSSFNLVLEKGGEVFRTNLSLRKDQISQRFSSVVSLDSLVEDQSENVKLYLEISDNDRVNGAKTTRSAAFDVEILGKQELKKKIDQQYQEFFDSKKELKKENKEILDALAELREKLLENKRLEWKDKQRLEETLKKQEDQLKKQEDLNKEIDKLEKEEEKFGPKNEEIQDQEERIDELKEDSKQEEIEKLMEEIEKLMEKLDPEELMEKLEQLQERNQQQERLEERTDELIKDLKFQKDVLEQAEKLEELAQKMEDLANKEESTEEESKEQAEIEKEFEGAKEKIEQMEKENKKFEQSNEEQDMQESQDEASEEMQDAQENLEKNEGQKANENQQNAGDHMSEMSQKLQNSMSMMSGQSMQENLETLRQILDNLETLSHGVEDLSFLSKASGKNDPLYRKILTEQKKLKDGAKIIEDSLVALSKRAPMIEQVVFEELDDIQKNLDRSIFNLEELRGAKAAANQQFVMTAANNLALMLEQSMQQMQQMMAAGKPGAQQPNCNKPGSKPSMKGLRQMQSELGEKMGSYKKGKKPGKGQKGQGEGNSKELVEMLSRQEQIRNQLEGLKEQMGDQGSNGDLQSAIDEMKELEKDLLNGQLPEDVKERVKDIETRLLESEKAEMEREQDEQREAKTADDKQQVYQEELEKYLKEKEQERETIDLRKLRLQQFYRKQATNYLEKL